MAPAAPKGSPLKSIKARARRRIEDAIDLTNDTTDTAISPAPDGQVTKPGVLRKMSSKLSTRPERIGTGTSDLNPILLDDSDEELPPARREADIGQPRRRRMSIETTSSHTEPGSTDDEDMKLAIELSLQDHQPSPHEGPVTITPSALLQAPRSSSEDTFEGSHLERMEPGHHVFEAVSDGHRDLKGKQIDTHALNDPESFRRKAVSGETTSNKTAMAVPKGSDMKPEESNGKTAPTKEEMPDPDQLASSTLSLNHMNRAQMEQERLARLKRKREDQEQGNGGEPLVSRIRTASPPAVTRTAIPGKIGRIAPGAGLNCTTPLISITANRVRNSSTQATQRPPSSPSTPRYYPKGRTLQTPIGTAAAKAISFDERTISFPTLIHPKSSLSSALLSSFIWDFDQPNQWLLPHFDLKSTSFQLVVQAKGEHEKQSYLSEFAGIPNVRLCFPPMDGNIACMHSKLMLLFYSQPGENGLFVDESGNVLEEKAWVGSRCRIVVPTANLVGFDWGIGGVMENTVWLIDLPLLPDSPAKNPHDETQFQKALTQFLKAQTVSPQVIAKLVLYDFSATANVGFVHTIGGSHPDERVWRTTGHCGLGRTVSQLGLSSAAADDSLQLDYVTSSVGSLTDEFMRSMYLAAQGDDGMTEYHARSSAKSNRKAAPRGESWRQNMRYYFPSDETVRASDGGASSAGTICFSGKWWDRPEFPKDNMRDCVSVRAGMLMHNKILFVRFNEPRAGANGRPNAGWVYIGTANLSESAWGRLVKDNVTKSPKLNCRNWECGVVVPVPAEASPEQQRDSKGLEVFANIVPIPMRYPAGTYGPKKRPWTYFG